MDNTKQSGNTTFDRDQAIGLCVAPNRFGHSPDRTNAQRCEVH
jgi:hypothetical protein